MIICDWHPFEQQLYVSCMYVLTYFARPMPACITFFKHILYVVNLFCADLPNLAEARSNLKSQMVRSYCAKAGYNFLAADWYGRGDSSGKLMEATISRWVQDTITFLDRKASDITGGMCDSGKKKAVFVGSGVGGWVALRVAMERPDLVRGFIGLSVDPDFTEDLLWAHLPEEEKEAIMRDGFREISWGGRDHVYPITSSLIVDARKHLILRGGPNSIKVDFPIKIIHSLEDEEVPVTVPLQLIDVLDTNDIELIVPKVGGHELGDRTVMPGWIAPESEFTVTDPPFKTELENALRVTFFKTSPPDYDYIW
mmetsp:Transcript_9553/g.14201  ORF Transcript_9553/g.14201 Transcript_9553/m.14201 type:complete len:311 (-) Transcript_9553:63-995(-)